MIAPSNKIKLQIAKTMTALRLTLKKVYLILMYRVIESKLVSIPDPKITAAMTTVDAIRRLLGFLDMDPALELNRALERTRGWYRQVMKSETASSWNSKLPTDARCL